MSLDRSAVEKIAHLARIRLAEPERDAYVQDLNAILALVEQMNAVPTDGIEPMAHPLPMVQRLRPDQPSEANRREDFQRLAPATEAGLYLVPRVVE